MTPPLAVPALTVLDTDAQNGVCTGQLDGDFAVTPDGAAVFRLPLWVPPGRNGLQPALALQYDSRSGYGLLGVGWGLAGLPKITRCQRRLCDDGYVAPIRFDASDAYCFAGQRMVAVDGIEGADGTEYRTRRESFRRITIKGVDRLGPMAFEVRDREGLIHTFQFDPSLIPRINVTPDGPNESDVDITPSDARYSWSLRRTEDRNGNTIEFDYAVYVGAPGTSLTAEFLPEQIRYTGCSDPSRELSALKSVRFYYGTHPEASIAYVAGLELRQAARLERIEVWGPNPTDPDLLRLYEITYRIAKVSGRSLIATIRECDGWPMTPAQDGSQLAARPPGIRPGVCKMPLVLDWEPGSPEFVDPRASQSGVLTDSRSFEFHGQLMPVDINGDGKDDLVCLVPTGALQPQDDGRDHLGMMITDESGIGFLQMTPFSFPRDVPPRPIDFDMDGRMDLILYDDSPTKTGGMAQTGLFRITVDQGGPGLQPVASFPPGQYEVCDLDGDRLADLILPWDSGSFWYNIGGQYFDGPLPIPVPPIGDPRVVGEHLIMDVDGDGAMEVLCPRFKSPPSFQFLPIPDPPDPKRYVAVGLGKQPIELNLFSNGNYVFADLNGDGLVDAVEIVDANPPLVNIWINTGCGFISGGSQQLQHVDPTTAEFRVINYTMDDHQQLLVRPLTGFQDDPMYVWRWNGSQLVEIPLNVRTLGTYDKDFHVMAVLDVDGDGLDDFVMLNQPDSARGPGALPSGGGDESDAPMDPPTLRLYQRMGKKPDLLTGIQNALGWQRSIRYESLSDPTVYSDTQPAAYPLYVTKARRWVVAEITLGDGRWGSTTRLYKYEDGRTDLRGEGFLGFLAQETNDPTTGVTTRSTYDFATTELGTYPLVGVPTQVVTTCPIAGGGARTRTISSAYKVRSDATNQIVFAFANSIHDACVETLGATTAVIQDATTTQDVDLLGNVTARSTAWTDGSSESYFAAYSPNVPDWLIGLKDFESYWSRASGGSVSVRRVAFGHDAIGQRTSKIIEPGTKTGTTYSALGPQPDGLTTLFLTYWYNPEGTIAGFAEAESLGPFAPFRSTTYEYDLLERMFRATTTNSLGQLTRTAYHPGLGVLAILEDANGRQENYQYDRFGRLRHHTPASQDALTVSYLQQAPLPAGIPEVPVSCCTYARLASGPEIHTVFDVLGRMVVERRLGRNDGRAVLWRTEYDSVGRPTHFSEPHFEADPPRWHVLTYDELGRLETRRLAVGSIEQFSYQGRTVLFTNARNRISTFESDEHGRLVLQSETSALATYCVTRYAYGPFDCLESIVDALGVVTRLQSDRLGRLTRVVDQNSRERRYSYSAFGELTTVARPGQTVRYDYDSLSRLTAITAPEGATVLTWDSAPKAIGRLATSVAPDGVSIDYLYDARGRLIAKQWLIAKHKYELRVAYDATGRMAGIRYPDTGSVPFMVKYKYGAFGELVSVVNAGTNRPYWTLITSDASGHFAQHKLGSGVVREWTESSVHPGLLDRIRDFDISNNDIVNLSHTYDGNLNLVQRSDAALKARELCQYDSLDRLVDWRRASAAGSLHISWTYNDVGDTVTVTNSHGAQTTLHYKYLVESQAVSSTEGGQYSYDGLGNQKAAPDRQIQFNSFDLPQSITIGSEKHTFQYDAERQRVLSSTAANTAIVSLAGLYQRRFGDKSHRFVIRVNGRPVAQVQRKPGPVEIVTYLHDDHLGSLQATSDDAGIVIAHFRYDPFGVRIDPLHPRAAPPSGSTGVVSGYSGHDESDVPGLIDMGARWYDPSLQRFVSPDPIRRWPGAGQAQNAYSYVMNNPLTWSDPAGLQVEDPDDADPFIQLVNQYLQQHTDDAWATLDAAVDWAHQQMTTAGAVPNDDGSGGAGISDLGMFAGFGRPNMSLPGTLVADAGRASDSGTSGPTLMRSGATADDATAMMDYSGRDMTRQVASLRALLARNGISSRITNDGTVLQTSAQYIRVYDVLKANFYSGLLAWNPFDHAAGTEFRTSDSPGFHFKLMDPPEDPKEPARLLPPGPGRITDMHLDSANPIRDNELLLHIYDFFMIKFGGPVPPT